MGGGGRLEQLRCLGHLSAVRSPHPSVFLQRMASDKNRAALSLLRWWCAPCGKDLQSAAALAEHCGGQRHWRLAALYFIANGPPDVSLCYAPKSRPQPRPEMTEMDRRFSSICPLLSCKP